MEFVIETGIPVPPRRGADRPRLPLAQMSVGDSIFVECDPSKKWVNVQLTRYMQETGKTFVVRRAIQDLEEGLRVFRTA